VDVDDARRELSERATLLLRACAEALVEAMPDDQRVKRLLGEVATFAQSRGQAAWIESAKRIVALAAEITGPAS
jgi:hypothetical protein